MADAGTVAAVGVLLLVVLLVLLATSLRVIQPTQVGVVVVLGAYRGLLTPGLHFVGPLRTVTRVEMGPRSADLDPLTVPGPSGAGLPLDADIQVRVFDPARFVFGHRNPTDEVRRTSRDGVVMTFGKGSYRPRDDSGWRLTAEALAEANRRAAPTGLGVTRLRVVARVEDARFEYVAESPAPGVVGLPDHPRTAAVRGRSAGAAEGPGRTGSRP